MWMSVVDEEGGVVRRKSSSTKVLPERLTSAECVYMYAAWPRLRVWVGAMVRMGWWSGEREGKRRKERGQEGGTKGFLAGDHHLIVATAPPRRRADPPSVPLAYCTQINRRPCCASGVQAQRIIVRSSRASPRGGSMCSAFGVKAQPPHQLVLPRFLPITVALRSTTATLAHRTAELRGSEPLNVRTKVSALALYSKIAEQTVVQTNGLVAAIAS